MYAGKIVFAQLMEHLPLHTLRRCIERFDGDRSVKGFSCQDQFRCMAFAQLTYRDSLRDTVTCLNAQSAKLYHMGLRAAVRRSTLADANEKRDWRLYQAFAAALIVQARRLYANEPLGVDLDSAAYALDTTTIDLCLSLFPWAPFQATKAALKLHTMMDLRGNIPLLVHIDDGKSYDTDILDVLTPEPGAVYIMDRGYLDFARLHRLTEAGAFFIIRTRRNLSLRRLASRPVDRTSGLVCDQIVRLAWRNSARKYPDRLRRIRYTDPETGKTLAFLTNNFTLPARVVADLYRCRWQIELFSVGQAAPAHQVVLRLLRERGEDADLDRGRRLRADRHRQEAARPVDQPLHNPAIAQCHHLRKNPAKSTAPRSPARKPTARARQATKSLRRLAGHYWV